MMILQKIHLMSLSLLFVLIFGGVAGADNLAAIDHYNKALDYANEGKFMLALNETDRALLENQNFTLAQVTRAGILSALGRYNESLDASDQAIALNPNQSAAWNNKAYALIHLRRYNEGLDAAERAAALDPALTEAWVNKGTALIALGRYEEAVTASEQALTLAPSSEEAKKNRDTAQESLAKMSATKTPVSVYGILGAVGLGAAAFIAGKIRR
jgi:tetratricopeptide (TPR) repeat protein